MLALPEEPWKGAKAKEGKGPARLPQERRVGLPTGEIAKFSQEGKEFDWVIREHLELTPGLRNTRLRGLGGLSLSGQR